MKLEQLYYLSEAIKFKSISIAARENFVPQSTVSSSISRLEKELETSLLNRSNKGITPTKSGQHVAEKSRQIFSLLNDIQASATLGHSKFISNISAMPSIVDTILADAVLKIEQDNQPMLLNVSTDEPSVILQNVQLGHSNLGIICSHQPISHPGLNCYPLFEDSYCLFVGQASSYFTHDSITIHEALSLRHIAYKSEYEKETNLLTRMTKAYCQPKIALRVDNTESMRRIISKSSYVAFFPRFTIYQDAYIDCNKIRALPLSDVTLKIYVSCIESPSFKDLQGNQLLLHILHQIIEQHGINTK